MLVYNKRSETRSSAIFPSSIVPNTTDRASNHEHPSIEAVFDPSFYKLELVLQKGYPIEGTHEWAFRS